MLLGLPKITTDPIKGRTKTIIAKKVPLFEAFSGQWKILTNNSTAYRYITIVKSFHDQHKLLSICLSHYISIFFSLSLKQAIYYYYYHDIIATPISSAIYQFYARGNIWIYQLNRLPDQVDVYCYKPSEG